MRDSGPSSCDGLDKKDSGGKAATRRREWGRGERLVLGSRNDVLQLVKRSPCGRSYDTDKNYWRKCPAFDRHDFVPSQKTVYLWYMT